MSAQEWAAEVAYQALGSVVTADQARSHYVAWASERGIRPDPKGMSAGLVAQGGRRRLRPLRWEGLALDPIPDSGYRARRASTLPVEVLVALAPIVDHRTLDQEYLRTTGTPASALCRYCGQVTRHTAERSHRGCPR